jgi:glycosyltransferase involved in cell wall biosynthesis
MTQDMQPRLSAARPRVLVINENESVPGDRRVWDISTTLTEFGYDVVVICPHEDREPGPSFEVRDGIEIHRFRPRFAEGGPLSYVREYGHALWAIHKLVRQLVRERPFDVVHTSNPPDFMMIAARPARRSGARLIFDHHDLTPELFLTRFGSTHRLLHRATLVCERFFLRAADVVLSTNASYAEVAERRGGKSPADVFIVRNAPDLRRLRPTAPDRSLAAGRPHLIAYLGVMAPQDGIDYALRSLAHLRRQRQDWHAVLAGEGPARQEMMKLADELGLSGWIDFPGWLGDREIATLLSSADICLSPEPRTPLNDISTMVKLAEYMAMSRPIVAFELRESRATADGAAIFAPADDVERYAECISALLDDPRRRTEMGAVGRARVEQQLSWDRSAATLRQAYEHALQCPPTKPRAFAPAIATARP